MTATEKWHESGVDLLLFLVDVDRNWHLNHHIFFNIDRYFFDYFLWFFIMQLLNHIFEVLQLFLELGQLLIFTSDVFTEFLYFDVFGLQFKCQHSDLLSRIFNI